MSLSEALWEHQTEAVAAIAKYLDGASHDDNALISMPTGTGKSAVMATAAAQAITKFEKHILVLTPWSALVGQFQTDVKSRLWQRLSIKASPGFPDVRSLPPAGRISEAGIVEKPTIFVDTIAAILAVQRHCLKFNINFQNLFSKFSAVFVDEGHYEPAPKWSNAIRGLQLPTVLLTATPYRNDDKYFKISGAHRYRYSHSKAVEEGLLRRPNFSVLAVSSPEEFVRELISFVDELPSGDGARIIVRCESADGIRRCVSELRRNGKKSLGVHHTFDGVDSLERNVPDPEAVDIQYWVHQNKLVEGIDDPRFKIVAVYDPLGNDRATIQQIGRVLRNPTKDPNDSKAWVVGRPEQDLEGTWKNYLKFDADNMSGAVATVPDLVKDLVGSQPGSIYFGGNYRRAINFEDTGAWKDFAYPLSTRIFRALDDVSPKLNDLFASISSEWQENDRHIFSRQSPDDVSFILPYIVAEISPLLKAGAFVEPRFGYTFVRLRDRTLFYFDARNRLPQVVSEYFVPAGVKAISRLLPEGSSLTSVSLANTNIGRQAARGRSIRAAAIEELAPDLADYAYICSRAEGYPRDADGKHRRYLGLSRSTVRDYRRNGQTFGEYDMWLNTLERQISNQKTVPADAFSRYSDPSNIPDDLTPVHILLDIDIKRFVKNSDQQMIPAAILDKASPINRGQFAITVNGTKHVATLEWDALRQRYQFHCQTLRNEAYKEQGAGGRELTSAIDADQAFRVVIKGNRYIYAHGEFFEPLRPDQKQDGFWLLGIMTGIASLENAQSEKGTHIRNGSWQSESVFGHIDAIKPSVQRAGINSMTQHFLGLDLLLCTDLGTEVADFIARQPGRVAFIHAKAAKGRRRSASVLQEVVGQAIKNLPHLHPASQTPPPIGTWAQPWEAPGKVVGSTPRLRHGGGNKPEQLWRQVRDVLTDPQADREVWLVLGAAMSVGELRKEAREPLPSAELLQIYALLQTAWSACTQMGVKLRIYCSP